MKDIKTIAFDADDTLWVNEPYFREAELQFAGLLEDYVSHHAASQELFKTEMERLSLYGYGVKGFMLCMIETILRVTDHRAPAVMIQQAINYGQDLLHRPIELLDGVEEVLQALSGKYRLVVATKGDLLDQERKLNKSGLAHYFHHIEIMSDKKEKDYRKLLKHLDCAPASFLMIGNSLKSDVMPVLDIGGHAFHIPYHTTWAHEEVSHEVTGDNLYTFEDIRSILPKLLEATTDTSH
ncbi:HAD family hydrolase [Chitinophaga pendula]|uniref:HAD family hydrolase n=1 Tax=Chitinophaga TaxID=79328 RepID=UPI000BB07515|nr:MULTISPECIES: HAD family hydrolase [Chitinophaga]ASZ12625.1 HAD family hydrolase [Chitinophaga sp. MD30]UCJ09767.1 HAD family hydrolase [Chitinophaga pendula]